MQNTTFQAPLVSTLTYQVSHFWPWKAHVLASQGPTPRTLKWAEGVMNILATRLLTVLFNGDLQICFFSPNSHPWFICTTLPQPTTRSSASNLDNKLKGEDYLAKVLPSLSLTLCLAASSSSRMPFFFSFPMWDTCWVSLHFMLVKKFPGSDLFIDWIKCVMLRVFPIADHSSLTCCDNCALVPGKEGSWGQLYCWAKGVSRNFPSLAMTLQFPPMGQCPQVSPYYDWMTGKQHHTPVTSHHWLLNIPTLGDHYSNCIPSQIGF